MYIICVFLGFFFSLSFRKTIFCAGWHVCMALCRLLFHLVFLWLVSRPFYLNFWNNQQTQTLQKMFILPLNCHPMALFPFWCLIIFSAWLQITQTELIWSQSWCLSFCIQDPFKESRHMALKTAETQTLCLIALGNNKEPPIFGFPSAVPWVMSLSHLSVSLPTSVFTLFSSYEMAHA